MSGGVDSSPHSSKDGEDLTMSGGAGKSSGGAHVSGDLGVSNEDVADAMAETNQTSTEQLRAAFLLNQVNASGGDLTGNDGEIGFASSTGTTVSRRGGGRRKIRNCSPSEHDSGSDECIKSPSKDSLHKARKCFLSWMQKCNLTASAISRS